MSVSAVCPTCNAVLTIVAKAPEACPTCSEALPRNLREAIAASLASDGAARPLPLQFGMLFCALFAVIALPLLALAPFNIGTYSINDRSVSGPEFLRTAGPVFGTAGLMCAVIAFGLWRNRTWSRYAILAYWLIVGGGISLIAESGSDRWSGVAFSLIGSGLAAAYLFRNKRAVSYYANAARSIAPGGGA